MARASLIAPIGELVVTTTALGVWRIDVDPTAILAGEDDASPAAHMHLDDALEQLRAYLDGSTRPFTVALDRSARRGFRGVVLDTLEGVGRGELITYGDLAARAGRPGAARAVGTAMATNPIPIIVPCHRVVRRGGDLGRYGPGPAAKRWLLELEGSI